MHYFGNDRNIFDKWRLYWMEYSYSQGFLHHLTKGTTKICLKQGYRDPEGQQCSKKTTYSFIIQIVRNQRMKLNKSNLFLIVPIEGIKCLMI